MILYQGFFDTIGLMNKILTVTLLTLFSVCILSAPTIFSSGKDATTQKNDVKIIQQDGATFLSTEIEQSATSSAATQSAKTIQTSENSITLPTGFAENIADLLNGILSFVMVLVALLVLFYLVMGGFGWITSGGDKGKIETARNKIFAALIGAILVASSYAILLLSLQFLGFADLGEVFSNVQRLDQPANPVETNTTINNEADSFGELL